MTVPMNELSTLAKFIYSTLTADTYWHTTYPSTMFYEEVIPIDPGLSLTAMSAMFVLSSDKPDLGNFGQRLWNIDQYQVKVVIEGTDFSVLEDAADQIDRLFDWQNQIDISAGRPKCQELYTDPDNSAKQLMVVSMVRKKALKYIVFQDGVNYAHLGGEYEITYYQPGG